MSLLKFAVLQIAFTVGLVAVMEYTYGAAALGFACTASIDVICDALKEKK